MIKSEHISQEDLQELLHSDGESEKTRNLGEHLHQCEQCRQAFDAMTARSEMWEKAPVLLKDKRMSDSAGTREFPRVDRDNADEPAWQYPITELLDPPRHPEMMGRIGKYDVEREVGRGGMGVVLKAHDAELNRPLAIKVLAPHLASNGTARKRFAQEAIAAAGVLHPNVIAVHGVNNEGKTPYIVMPYVPGPSLQTIVDQQGPLTEIEITRIALQIASGGSLHSHFRVLSQQPFNYVGQGFGYLMVHLANRCWIVILNPVEHTQRRFRAKWQPAGRKEIDQASQAEQIAALIRTFSPCLFRRHVIGSSRQPARSRQ